MQATIQNEYRHNQPGVRHYRSETSMISNEFWAYCGSVNRGKSIGKKLLAETAKGEMGAWLTTMERPRHLRKDRDEAAETS